MAAFFEVFIQQSHENRRSYATRDRIIFQHTWGNFCRTTLLRNKRCLVYGLFKDRFLNTMYMYYTKGMSSAESSCVLVQAPMTTVVIVSARPQTITCQVNTIITVQSCTITKSLLNIFPALPQSLPSQTFLDILGYQASLTGEWHNTNSHHPMFAHTKLCKSLVISALATLLDTVTKETDCHRLHLRWGETTYSPSTTTTKESFLWTIQEVTNLSHPRV